jgi:hypothetical protein
MAHDVFISYSAKNKTTADAVCVMLVNPALGYQLKWHWLDALHPPLEHHLQRLCDTVKVLLAGTAASGEPCSCPARHVGSGW